MSQYEIKMEMNEKVRAALIAVKNEIELLTKDDRDLTEIEEKKLYQFYGMAYAYETVLRKF